MNWRDVIAVLLGIKKPVLVPLPKNEGQQKR